MLRRTLVLALAASLALVGRPAVEAQTSGEAQAVSSAASKSTSPQQPQQMHGNLSSMMVAQSGPTQMTNASLAVKQPLSPPSSSAATKGASAAKGAAVAQPAVGASSQAQNSRQLKQASRKTDSQMSAEDSTDSQAFVTINSQPSSVSSEPSRVRANESAASGANGSSGPSGSGAPAAPKSGAKWATQTAPAKQPHQTQQSPAVLAPPPAPSWAPTQSQWRARGKQQQVERQKYSAQMALDGAEGGYSYEANAHSGAYMHTSPLSPARQELAQAELVAQRQRQFGRQFYGQQTSARPSPPSEHRQQQQQQQQQQLSQQQQQLEQFAVGSAARAQSPSLGYRLAAPVPGTPPSPCRPPAAFGQQTADAGELVGANSARALPNFSGAHKYVRLGEGSRLRSQFVFKVVRADSLADCESACSSAGLSDACRSFNYRAYFAAENCELSRLEADRLRLDDGGQFEQHTQFDFYALAGRPADSPLADAADCLDVAQSCSADGMEFTLRTSEPFRGRIYTYGFYDSCFTDADGSTATSLRISRANGFPRCGTQLLGDLMTNLVVVQFSDHVQTTRDRHFNLTCYFAGPAEAVVTSSYLDAKVDERSQATQVEHLPAQNVLTSNVHLRVLYRGQPTNSIALGDLLTFRLESRAHSGARADQRAPGELFASNVLARDPYSGRQVLLIDARGCPVDALNVFPELQRTPDGALESEFYAFKIPDANFLIFQATVRTCRAPCEPAICPPAQAPPEGVKGAHPLRPPPQALAQLQSAASSVPSWGRRRRRRTADELADEPLALGESVEHVIPARLHTQSAERPPAWTHSAQPVRTFRRPELSEAEQEVKELFRVYMSRAEIHQQQRQPQAPTDNRMRQSGEQSALTSGQRLTAAEEGAEGAESLGQLVCLSHFGFYAILFSLIALTLLTLSVLLVALVVARKAKFRLSDSVAHSLF